MKYIKYWNSYPDSLRDGYIVKEEDDHLVVCPPLAYLWMNHCEDFSLLTYVQLIQLDKTHYTFVEEEAIPFSDDWIFGFDITQENRHYFEDFTRFFSYFLAHSFMPLTRRLEVSIEQMSYSIDKSQVRAIIEYILAVFGETVHSPTLLKYLHPKETRIGQFVRYSDVYSEGNHFAYLLKEDDEFYYFIEPLSFELLKRTNQLHLLEQVKPFRYNKHWFSYSFADCPMIDEWILSFPFESADLEYLHAISYFFDTFQRYHDFPFIHRLEVCTRHKRYPITDQVMAKLVQFVGSHFKHERIRMMMSEQLGTYFRSY